MAWPVDIPFPLGPEKGAVKTKARQNKIIFPLEAAVKTLGIGPAQLFWGGMGKVLGRLRCGGCSEDEEEEGYRNTKSWEVI